MPSSSVEEKSSQKKTSIPIDIDQHLSSPVSANLVTSWGESRFQKNISTDSSSTFFSKKRNASSQEIYKPSTHSKHTDSKIQNFLWTRLFSLTREKKFRIQNSELRIERNIQQSISTKTQKSFCQRLSKKYSIDTKNDTK